MKKRLLLLPFIFLTTTSAFAQQLLKGKVINQDKNPVLYIKAILLKNDTTILQQTTTDSLGLFSMKTENGNYTLLLKQFGTTLLKKEIAVNQNTDLGEIIINEPITLEGVVITADKRVIEQVGDKLYFNVENSPIAKGNNGLDVLQKSPKLNVNSDGDVLLKNKSTSVLINGRKANLTGANLSSYLSSLHSEDIKRVEIQDVASADQDATTDGGVVNIILKKNTIGLRTIASTNYIYRKDKYGSYNGNLNLNYGTNVWNMYANIAYTENNDLGIYNGSINYFTGQKNVRTGSFDQFNNNLSFRLGSNVQINNRNEIGIEGYLDKSKLNFDDNGDFNILTNNSSSTRHSINHSQAKTKDNLWYTTINYNFKTDDKGSQLKFIGDAGEKDSKPFNDVFSQYPDDSSLNSNYLYNTKAHSKYYTLQLDFIQKFENDWELNAGVKFGDVKRDNLLFVQYLRDNQWIDDLNQNQDFNNREKIFAGYATVSKKAGKSYIKAGFRVEQTDIKGINQINNQDLSQNYGKIFPSLYYRYDLAKEKSLAFMYKRSILRPFFSDLNPFVVKQNDYLYLIGNPNLQPSYIDRIELNFDYKKSSFSFFGKKTSNTIQGAYTVDENLVNYFQPKNFGRLYDAGLDYSYNTRLTKWLYGNLGTGIFYSYFEAVDGITTKGTSFYNNIYLQVKLPDNWLIELTNNYQHRYYSKNLRGEPKYKTDISARKSFDKGRLLATMKVTDIFNTRIDQNLSFYKEFESDFRRKMLTRGIMLQIQYTLDSKQKIKSNTVKSENDSRGRL